MKRKPIKLWVAKTKTGHWVNISTKEPKWILWREEWQGPCKNTASVCAEEFEKVLGKQLWPHPYLAEIDVPPFKVVKYWEPN